MATTKETLTQARTLIQEHKYAEARRLLQPIADHPTAAQWLAKIDTMIPGEARTSRAKSASNASTERPKTNNNSGSNSGVLIVGLIVIVVVIGLFAVLSGAVQIPQLFGSTATTTYADERMKFDYPINWTIGDAAVTNWCSYEFDPCLIFLSHPSGPTFYAQHIPLQNPISVEEFAEYILSRDLENFDNFENELTQTPTTVGSASAMMHYYMGGRVDLSLMGEIYDVLVVDGLDGYVFTFTTQMEPCQFNDEVLPDINRMLSSVRFASPNITTEADGFTASSPWAYQLSFCD